MLRTLRPIVGGLPIRRPLYYNKSRSIFGLFKKKEAQSEVKKLVLEKDDLFHNFLTSPIKEIRDKGEFIKANGSCAECLGDEVLDITLSTSSKSKRPNYTCPDCGIPTHCSEEHYKANIEEHKKYCSHLKSFNLEEHDLRSGRSFKEFNFPKDMSIESTVNLTNWDTFFVTRQFENLDKELNFKHVTKVLTYPMTISSIIHPFGPHYKRLTLEGKKSLAALNYTLGVDAIKDYLNQDNKTFKVKDKVRIFILGARAEGQLPPIAYLQLCYLFPTISFHLYFVGPETRPPPSVPNVVPISKNLTFHYKSKLFHEDFHDLTPFDNYRDIFFMFHPGLAYPQSYAEWTSTLKLLLETKCPIFLTGYDNDDITNDHKRLTEEFENEMDWLLHPIDNPFAAMKRDINLLDVRMMSQANCKIMGIRGKRYEVIN